MARIDYDENETTFKTLCGKVFRQLENDILNGKYKEGESLIETKISSELGVSRTPVREAIRQLELEGLVKFIPNRGAIVQGITLKDIEDIYTIRMMIEGLAARWAAEKITPEELKELQEIVDLEEFYTARGDAEQLLKLDSRFHETLFNASKSRPLKHMLSMFHHYTQRARSISLAAPGRPDETFREHKAILEAIIEKDAEKAQILTTQHIKNVILNLDKQNINV